MLKFVLCLFSQISCRGLVIFADNDSCVQGTAKFTAFWSNPGPVIGRPSDSGLAVPGEFVRHGSELGD
jgi:hypothetical protein